MSSTNDNDRENDENDMNRKDSSGDSGAGLNSFEAGLAMLSAIIGGGIVGIPYAMVHTGIPAGLILNIVIVLAGVYSGTLYLKCKDLTPTVVESMYELGYVVLGVKAIWILSTLILIAGIGSIMIYFIVFGDIAKSLAEQAYGFDKENVLTRRPIYVICIAVLMSPIILKKRLKEMKFVSFLLFMAIAVFILLFLVQMFTLGTAANNDEDYRSYWKMTYDLDLITSFNTVVLAYAYQINLFPTYNSLGENKTNETAVKAIKIGSSLTFFVYTSLGILSIYTFGESLEDDVFINVDEEQNIYSLIIRIAFLIVLACHIPYSFFPTKESLLLMIDEY